MSYLLVFSSHNYADEFDRTGVKAVKKSWWDAHVEGVKSWWDKNKGEYQSIGFGTNEALHWTSAEDYLNGFTVKEISKDEYDTFIRLMDGETAGDFECLDHRNMKNSNYEPW